MSANTHNKFLRNTGFSAACVALSVIFCAGAGAQPGTEPARQLFARYQQLEHNFDPALAQLYADGAIIKVTRIYAGGVQRQLLVPGDLYQLALRQSMPLAKAEGDYNRFRDVSYHAAAGGVRIRATRYSVWRNYTSPYTALVARGADGHWRIVEETIVQQMPVKP